MGICGCQGRCTCSVIGGEGTTVTGSGDTNDPFVITAASPDWTGTNVDGSIEIIPGGAQGHEPIISVRIDPAGSASPSVSGSGLKFDCCGEEPITIEEAKTLYGNTQNAPFNNSGYPQDLGKQALLNSLGWNPVAQTIPYMDATTTVALLDGRAVFIPVYLPFDKLLTGIVYGQGVQGNFTNVVSRIALYTSDGTDLTRVARTANTGSTGALWKHTADGIYEEDFDAPYAAVEGRYYLGILANWSAVVTSPTVWIQSAPPAFWDVNVSSLVNQAEAYFVINQADLDPTVPVAGLTAFDQPYWLAIF